MPGFFHAARPVSCIGAETIAAKNDWQRAARGVN
jgi:hypothetical protein